MAKSGVWGLQQVRDKYLQSDWTYSGLQTLFAWGYNNYGQLVDNSRTNRSSPIQIPGTWKDACGNSMNIALINTSGELYTAGANEDGQLGLNNRTNYSSPVQIPGTTWSIVWSANEWMAATKTDGTFWTWGKNESGNLGLNNKTDYSSPVQVPGTDWPQTIKKSGGAESCMAAVKTDGTLWVWGSNDKGGLGQNEGYTPSKRGYSSPVQVGSGTDWVEANFTTNTAAALKTDGTLWTWGDNDYGNLGNTAMTTSAISSPTQVPGTTWSSVRMGDACYALKTDGTLWAWGDNTDGLLGQNDTVRQSSPVQIPGTDWSDISPRIGRGKRGMATKTDGTLWMWGDNDAGELGQNQATVQYSSPIQVTGSPWTPLSVDGESGEGPTLAFRSV